MYKFTVTQPTSLDKVVNQFYNDLANFKEVLEANENLRGKLILEVGDVVSLPVIVKKEETKAKRLWD